MLLPRWPVHGKLSVVMSYAGCAGQRCMAASMLLLVGADDEGGLQGLALLRRVIEKSSEIRRGTGPGEIGRGGRCTSNRVVIRDIVNRATCLTLACYVDEHAKLKTKLSSQPRATSPTCMSRVTWGPTQVSWIPDESQKVSHKESHKDKVRGIPQGPRDPTNIQIVIGGDR